MGTVTLSPERHSAHMSKIQLSA